MLPRLRLFDDLIPDAQGEIIRRLSPLSLFMFSLTSVAHWDAYGGHLQPFSLLWREAAVEGDVTLGQFLFNYSNALQDIIGHSAARPDGITRLRDQEHGFRLFLDGWQAAVRHGQLPFARFLLELGDTITEIVEQWLPWAFDPESKFTEEALKLLVQSCNVELVRFVLQALDIGDQDLYEQLGSLLFSAALRRGDAALAERVRAGELEFDFAEDPEMRIVRNHCSASRLSRSSPSPTVLTLLIAPRSSTTRTPSALATPMPCATSAPAWTRPRSASSSNQCCTKRLSPLGS